MYKNGNMISTVRDEDSDKKTSLFMTAITDLVAGDQVIKHLHMPQRFYNHIMAMGFSAMFTFQLEVNIAGTPLP